MKKIVHIILLLLCSCSFTKNHIESKVFDIHLIHDSEKMQLINSNPSVCVLLSGLWGHKPRVRGIGVGVLIYGGATMIYDAYNNKK